MIARAPGLEPRRPLSTSESLAIHDRQGAPSLSLQTAKHYVAVEALVLALLQARHERERELAHRFLVSATGHDLLST